MNTYKDLAVKAQQEQQVQYEVSFADNIRLCTLKVDTRDKNGFSMTLKDSLKKYAEDLIGSSDRKIALLLDYSFESLLAIEAFSPFADKVDFLTVRHLSVSTEVQNNYLERFYRRRFPDVKFETLSYDLSHPESLSEIEKLMFFTGIADPAVLVQICYAQKLSDKTCIFPGRFVLPSASSAGKIIWSFPADYEFLKNKHLQDMGHIPSLMAATPQILVAQRYSEYTEALAHLIESESLCINDTELLRESFYNWVSGIDFLLPKSEPIAAKLWKHAFYSCSRTDMETLNINIHRTIKKSVQIKSDIQFETQNLEAARKPSEKLLTHLRNISKSTRIFGNIETFQTLENPYKSQLHGAFFSPLSTHTFDAPLEPILDYVRNLEFGEHQASRSDLLDFPEMESLNAFFQKSIDIHLRALDVYFDDFEITQCWATKIVPGNSFVNHYHSNSYLSAIFYLHDTEGSNTVFTTGRTDMFAPLRPNSLGLLTDQVEVRPTKGTLLIFPSNLFHFTRPNLETSGRHTIAFNVMLRGHIGDLSLLNLLKL